MSRLLLVVVIAGTLTSVSRAQIGLLTPEQIDSALREGTKQDLAKTGLQINVYSKTRRSLQRLFGADDSQEQPRVTLFSPTTWVQRAAAQARSEYKTLTADDLSEIDLAPILRVFVNFPNTRQIVLRDEAKSRIIQPLRRVEHDRTVEAVEVVVPFGNRLPSDAFSEFQFDLADVHALRSATGDRLILTVVIQGRIIGVSEPGEIRGELDGRLTAEHLRKLR